MTFSAGVYRIRVTIHGGERSMWMKKLLAYGSAGLLAAGLMVMPVSAHGHHAQTSIPADQVCGLCTVTDCAIVGLHTHDNQTYCGYNHACGYCDGSCGVVGICSVEGCTQTGRHVHGDQTYCGAGHMCGYCDGSCVRSTAGQAGGQGSGYGGGYGHHGRHGHHGR